MIVSRDGPRVYLYSDSEEPAREVLRTVSARIEQEGHAAVSALERWHPVEQAWRDGSIPLPDTEEEIAEEHERLQQREAAESAETGDAQWEVRIELTSHEDTEALAERLESEGIPVVRRHTFLLAGAANEDDAKALADEASRRGSGRREGRPSSRAEGWSGRSLPGIRSRFSAASGADARPALG